MIAMIIAFVQTAAMPAPQIIANGLEGGGPGGVDINLAAPIDAGVSGNLF